MTPARAAEFLTRAEQARSTGGQFHVTAAEYAELIDSITNPPDTCPTCGTPTVQGCTRDVDVDNQMGPHWLPPAPTLPVGSHTFNGTPIYVDPE